MAVASESSMCSRHSSSLSTIPSRGKTCSSSGVRVAPTGERRVVAVVPGHPSINHLGAVLVVIAESRFDGDKSLRDTVVREGTPIRSIA